MTTTTQLPAVLDYLVATSKSWPGLGGARVSVFDGVQPPAATQSLERVLWWGADPSQPDAVFGDIAQSWPVLDKGRTKDEDGTVAGAVQHWSGDPVVKVHRDAATAMLAQVELMLRGDGTTGPGDMTMGGLCFWSSLDTARWETRQISNGVAVLIAFTVTYRARLTTTGA